MREPIIGGVWIVKLGLVKLVLHDCLAALGMMDLALHLLVALEQTVEVHEVILGGFVGETSTAFCVLCEFLLWGLILRLRCGHWRRLQFHVEI